MPARSTPRRGVTLAVVVAAAAILAYQLFVSPIVGLANNGDFEKIMGIVGLNYPPGTTAEQKYFRWMSPEFVFVTPNWWRSGYRTSETLLVRAAMIPARWATGGRSFDIRWLGVVHAALFLLFFGVIARSLLRGGAWRIVACSAAGLFFFTDVGYVAPMNSLYGQEASFLALFGILAVLATATARGGFTAPLATAYGVFAVFFVASKPQEAVQAVVLAAFGVWMTRAEKGAAPAAGWAVALVIVIVGAWCWSVIPSSMREASLRKVVFDEILPRSPDPRRDLREMGLDPGWAGRSSESLENDAGFRREFRSRFSHRRLLVFYLRHPARTADTLFRTARAAMTLRPPWFGNLPPRSGFRERQPSAAFGVWSSIRAAAAPAAPGVLAAIFGGSFIVAWRVLRRGGDVAVAAKGTLLLVALGAVAFAVCALGGSRIDLERHLFVFDAVTDALLALAIGAAAGRLGELA